MAATKKAETTATDKAAENTQPVIKYPLDNLRKNARELFDISTSTFDGATYGLDTDATYSVAEIENIINNWLKKPVKTN